MEQTEPQNVRKRTTLFCCNRSKFQTLPGGGSTLYAALAPPLSLPRNATSLKDPQNLQTKPYGQNQRGGATIPSMTLVRAIRGGIFYSAGAKENRSQAPWNSEKEKEKDATRNFRFRN